MANFIIIIDPDRDRRAQFFKTIEPLLPPVEGLITHSCASGGGDFQAIWAAASTAPIDYATDREGASFILGEAILPDSSTRIDADSLRQVWQDFNSEKLPIFDGFYAAAAYNRDRGLTVGADLLGLFPIYFYADGDVILVGSSPELFRHHPHFRKKLNLAGLVGILLVNCLFEGQTLWQNVRRLKPGHLLVWRPNEPVREIAKYQISGSSDTDRYSKLSFNEQVDLLDRAFEKALTRLAPNDARCCLMLSGGLDSRMLAGFMSRLNLDSVALTFGDRADLEMECAVSVARALGFKHYSHPEMPFDRYPFYARQTVKWEHLANGFNCIRHWGFYDPIASLAPRVTTGHFDRSIGGKFIGVHHGGFSVELLEKLLRKELFGDVVREQAENLHKTYNSYSDVEFRRGWLFDIYHRNRLQIQSVWWRLSFGAWPIVPVLDRELLEIATRLPVATIAKRRAEEEIVRTRFAKLARLPLDRNDSKASVEPLQPSKTRQLLAPLFELQRKWRRLQQELGYERVYYRRIYDVNHAGWQAVRQQAEPYRDLAKEFFQPEEFEWIVPPVEIRENGDRDPFKEGSQLKTLVGLLLWFQANL